MKIQSFKNFIGETHEVALSRELGIPRNPFSNGGIDLLNDEVGVEVKGCLIRPESSKYKERYVKWTLFDHQLDWDKKYDARLYCALGSYTMNASYDEVEVASWQEMEEFVTGREFWVVPWDWTLGFPISFGKYHDYRYLKRSPAKDTGIPPMPGVIYSRDMDKGRLHFTEGVNLEDFGL